MLFELRECNIQQSISTCWFLSGWWAHLDSNQGPTGYEPATLTAELWAHVTELIT